MKLIKFLFFLLVFVGGFFVGFAFVVTKIPVHQEQEIQPAVDTPPKKVYVSTQQVQGSTVSGLRYTVGQGSVSA